MRFIPGQDSFSISYRGGRAFDDNFTVDFFPGRGQSVYDVDTGLQFGEYLPMVFGKSADDLYLQVKDSSRLDRKSKRLNSSHILISRMPSSA